MEDYFAFYAFAACIIIVLVCIVVKTVYWKKSGRVGITRLIRSFFKWYKAYHMFNASSSNRQAFMRVSNKVNVIFWSMLFFGLLCMWKFIVP